MPYTNKMINNWPLKIYKYILSQAKKHFSEKGLTSFVSIEKLLVVANHYGQSAGQVAEKQDEKEEARLKGNVRQGKFEKEIVFSYWGNFHFTKQE